MKVTKKTVLLSLAVAAPVLLGGGYVLAKKVAWPRYKQYRAASFERSARDYLAQGDFDNAMLFARKNLAADQSNVANWRLAAEITEQRDDPNALFYLQRLLAVDPSLDNRLRLIRFALARRADAVAEKAISGAGAEARDSAEFHELAARASLRTGKTIQAKFHLITLCNLRPDDHRARLDLARIRLDESGPDLRGSIRSEIRGLASDATVRIAALTALLADSIAHKESADSLDLVAEMRRESGLEIPSALTIANALRLFDPPAFETYSAELRQLAGDRPADIARVGMFLIQSQRSGEVLDWVAALPSPLGNDSVVQRMRAAAHAELRQWGPLADFLKASDWKEIEFERLALLSYAQQKLGQTAAFAETWRLALAHAAANQAKLNLLLQHTAQWRWDDQRFEVLWKLFQLDPREASVQRQLFARERALGNTANLNRLFARLLEVAPDDASTKNNFAYTCLLLGTNTARAEILSREALAADPRNAYFATTRALALLRTGAADEARALLAEIGAVQLWQPEQLIVQAAVLVANSAFEAADQLVANATPAGLLPEEQHLLADTRASIEKHRASTTRTAEISADVAAHRTSTAARSLLALLPPGIREQPTLQMELADSLYARDEFAPLAKELGATTWEKHDFLRLALLAHAQRQLGRTSASRDTWRLAINTTGTRTEQQRALATLAATWGWTDERIDLLGRILQRAADDNAVLDEIVAHFTRLRRTGDLARTYGSVVAAGNASPTVGARFAYYSLLVDMNTSDAHVAAKTAFDQNPSDLFAARALALSLSKQGQAHAGLQLLGNFTTRISPDVDLSLVLALLHEATGNLDAASQSLAAFNAETALPEEIALADAARQRLQAD